MTQREEEMFNDIMDILDRAEQLDDKPHRIWNGIRLLALKYLRDNTWKMQKVERLTNERYLGKSPENALIEMKELYRG